MIRTIIIDDDKLVRMGLLSAISWEKHNIKILADLPNGMKALEFIKKENVDLAFIDIEMPEMQGLELLKHMKRVSPSTQGVMLTMHQEFSFIQEALRIGVLDYIIKSEMTFDNIDDILKRITNRFDNEANTDYLTSANNTIERCVQKAVRIVHEETEVFITATQMAQRVNISRGYFSTCFKQITGSSYNEFFRMQRMEMAKKLLEKSDKPITAIAMQVGYTNEKYFATVFKAYTGVRPSKYKKSINMSE